MVSQRTKLSRGAAAFEVGGALGGARKDQVDFDFGHGPELLQQAKSIDGSARAGDAYDYAQKHTSPAGLFGKPNKGRCRRLLFAAMTAIIRAGSGFC
jgi:hypothetical protein